MNRREFLKGLGAAAICAVIPVRRVEETEISYDEREEADWGTAAIDALPDNLVVEGWYHAPVSARTEQMWCFETGVSSSTNPLYSWSLELTDQGTLIVWAYGESFPFEELIEPRKLYNIVVRWDETGVETFIREV